MQTGIWWTVDRSIALRVFTGDVSRSQQGTRRKPGGLVLSLICCVACMRFKIER